ncbi:trypsin-like peptidase domain-containing protein [Romboutsia sp.]|uniref:trypsin-like peptidase domain-containing protein n=1 Tax=Romboutsia sp. TaxID=1965302 RepID=UPI003F379E8D
MYNNMAYVCENEYQNFFNLPNVNGLGIGNKIINGIDTLSPCLKVMVIKKVGKEELQTHEIIPKEYKGIPTDVVEVGEIYAHGNTGKIRPAQGGYSIGVVGTFIVGTLGCLVSNGTGSALKTYILSNNHVIALENTAPIGSLILQPGQADGGINPGDGIANLSSFVPVNFSGGNNLVDCAIAQVISTTLVSSQIVSIGNITGIASAIVGGFVQKSGRSTSYTTGTIQSINTTLLVNYSGGKQATFIRQLVASSMSQVGDSGSIVLDSSNRAIGLIFASSTSITALNDIRDVLKSFRARLV